MGVFTVAWSCRHARAFPAAVSVKRGRVFLAWNAAAWGWAAIVSILAATHPLIGYDGQRVLVAVHGGAVGLMIVAMVGCAVASTGSTRRGKEDALNREP